jgi:hypothetical protein
MTTAFTCGPAKRIVRRELARTLCKDGYVVSSIAIVGLGQQGGDNETAVLSPHSFGDILVRRFQRSEDAMKEHADAVADHGGPAGFIKRLLRAIAEAA